MLFPGKPFHGDVSVFVGGAVGDVTNDAWMLEQREDFGFALETFAVGFFVEEDFERNGLIRSEIERAEDPSHSALADEGFEAKTSAHDLPDLHAGGSIGANGEKVYRGNGLGGDSSLGGAGQTLGRQPSAMNYA
jgi:hypothetical protein